MKIVKCLIILLLFVKLNFFLRIFDTFSFLVSMLQDVFSDLSAFLAFFMMAVAIFSCMIQVLLPETKVNYDGAGYFSYLMMAFRTSIGDYTFDNYKATMMKEVTWIVWLALMIIGNVVFMNFIIAVVNDSYSTSMAKKVSQSYRLKVPLIIEREKLFREQQDVKDKQILRMKEMEEEKQRIVMLTQKGANPRDQENNEESKLT
jgi:signal transduction histidine kinase